ncbi:hypothetical protein KKH56_01425 [bacterium]|nr:hypothetical protein [bacterium]
MSKTTQLSNLLTQAQAVKGHYHHGAIVPEDLTLFKENMEVTILLVDQEIFNDYYLAEIADYRFRNSTESDYVGIDEFLKKAEMECTK